MFGKKMTKEQVLNAFKALPQEEQDELLKSFQADEPVVEDEKVEEVVEEPVEEAEEVVEEEVKEEGEPVPEDAVVEKDEIEEDNKEVIIKQLTDRLEELEKRFGELCSKIDEHEIQDANRFGYAGKGVGAKKDIKDMSADELRNSILSGEY